MIPDFLPNVSCRLTDFDKNELLLYAKVLIGFMYSVTLSYNLVVRFDVVTSINNRAVQEKTLEFSVK